MLNKRQVQTIQRTPALDDNELPRVFGVLGDPTRWKIFSLLIKHEGLCVTDLAHILEVSVPAVSQQLRVMEMAGLVHKERMGQMICYRIEQRSAITYRIVRLAKLLNKLRGASHM